MIADWPTTISVKTILKQPCSKLSMWMNTYLCFCFPGLQSLNILSVDSCLHFASSSSPAVLITNLSKERGHFSVATESRSTRGV